MSNDLKNDIRNARTTSPDHSVSRHLAEITFQNHVLDSYSWNINQFAFKNLLSISMYTLTSAHILPCRIAPQFHLFECSSPPIYLTYTKFLDWNFFLANHTIIATLICTFNCEWVGAILKKQPLRWYEFLIYFVNHFACFCDENS